MPKMPVKIPHMSSFSRSFATTGTSKVGTITPLSIDEVDAGKGSLKINLAATMPPLASDTFMRCKVKVEAFMVPLRLLYGGFTDWVMRNTIRNTTTSVDEIPGLPLLRFDLSSSTDVSYLKSGTLMDYLGFKYQFDSLHSSADYLYMSALPVACYRRVIDDWYKRLDVQLPAFKRSVNSSGALAGGFVNLPWYTMPSSYTAFYAPPGFTMFDGSHFCDLAQRNFGFDYFTMATPNAQKGSAQEVDITSIINSAGTAAEGSFTIASLRAANRLQQFAERRAYGSERWQDYCKVTWGTDLSSGVAQRSIFLGGASFDVYTKGISQTAQDSSSTNNPFNGVGAQYGKAYAAGSEFIVNYNVSEPSYILVNATLVPEVRYGTGADRIFFRYMNDGDQVNMANPILQGLGNQPVYQFELNSNLDTSTNTTDPLSSATVFGYSQRYADFMHKDGQVHGLMRDGESLDAFVAQRSFPLTEFPTMSSNFLQIPTTYLDQVTAVSSTLSNYGWIFDAEIIHKISMPLNQFSIPSLEDPDYEHQKTVWVENNGSQLR